MTFSSELRYKVGGRKLYFRTKTISMISVIGDEILKGSTMDTNSHFICMKLHELGVQVKKFSQRYDYVFTTGGVGPTHDDKTYIGLAKAFNDNMRKSSEIVEAIENYFPSAGLSKDHSVFVDKLSTIPASAQLLWGTRSSDGKSSNFPVVRLSNVISLPGVPRFCERAFVELKVGLESISLSYYIVVEYLVSSRKI
ncbi:unnamed protein product [Cylicostephanus goldi]|uniref:MoaB/Mog domain-containing protein n=1 Tax=Cylicostephanus goldi TaxID=71465 RepID=A0A3P7QIW5_CYLGO|nr:unnamed protein product [Cylicostephanus goldi]